MSTVPAPKPAPTPQRQRGPRRPPGGADLGQGIGREARRIAATILEVLAGCRSTGEAAALLEISMTRYYVLETRALQGLVAACEPRVQGRVRSAAGELQALRLERDHLKRDLMRQQALVRAAQRTVGLTPPPAAPAKAGGKKRRRRPVARALTVAAQLQTHDNSPDTLPAGAPANVCVQDGSARR